MWDFIKQFISSRGAQLIARYVGTGLVSLATYLGVTISGEDNTKFSIVAGTILAALLCKAVDLISHAIQKQQTEKEIEDERELGRVLVERAKGFNKSLLLVLALLPFLTGCSFSEKLGAGIGAAIMSAATHIEPTITYNADTGEFHASVHFKDGTVRALTAAEMEQQCLACNDHAQKELKASFKRAIADMRAMEKTQLAALKAQRVLCHRPGNPQIAHPPISHPPPNVSTGPQPGDVVEPATGADGSFSIPGEKGLWRVVPKEKPACKLVDGKWVCP